MVRINIELPDELHKDLKIDAVMRGITLKDFLVELLRKHKTLKHEVKHK